MEGETGVKLPQDLTLVFCRRGGNGKGKEILLGLKKRGFGTGKYNGFGGKVEEGETIPEAAARELLEEATIRCTTLVQKGDLTFELDSYPRIMRVHVFEATKWYGSAQETEEMKPQWFSESEIPYENMWPDDQYWLPLFLAGKDFQGQFSFSDDSTIVSHTLTELPSTATTSWKAIDVNAPTEAQH